MLHRNYARCELVALSWTLLLVMPALAHGQAVTAAWDPSPPANQVTGYQVCVGTSSLSCNVALASVGGSTTTYRFTPAGGTFYYVATRATNAAGASPYSSEVRFSIPSFAQPANQTSAAGSAITAVNLSISDPDGSALTITHTGLPVGLSINTAQRRITGTPVAAGTHNVTVFVNDGLVTVSRSFVWTVAGAGAPVSTNLIWHNNLNGQNLVWYLNGTTLLSSANLPPVTDTNWQGVASADINRDGASDLIWRNRVTGQSLVWYLNGTTLLSAANLPTVSDTNWQIMGSADINRDGASDLIWRNAVTGQNVVWYLNGTTLLYSASLPTVTDANWQIVVSADIDRDGAPDLIWRNRVTGENAVWYLNGATLRYADSLPTVVEAAWRIVSALDLNNDGATDLVWRNNLTGANYVWYLNRVTLMSGASLPSVTDGNWQIVGR